MADYRDISISWHGDLTSISGTAHHARALLKPLILGGANVHLIPQPTQRPCADLDKWWENTINQCVQNPPGLLMVNHGAPTNPQRCATGGPTILFTHWETDKVPKTWVDLMNNNYDEIWLPNKWSIEEGRASAIKKPFKVIPYPVDAKEIQATTKATQIVGIREGSFVFGCSGLWNNRKNLSDIIVAYYGEFSSMDRVALVIKTNGQNAEDPNERAHLSGLIKDIKKSFNKPDLPPVVLMQDIFGYQAMNSIIRRFDCFASTSRGESKNITMMKCMALGTPCIYMPKHANAELHVSGCKTMHSCKSVSEPVMQMGNYYSALDRWARPDLGSYMDAMRKVYNDHFMHDTTKERAKMVQKIERLYSPDVVIPKFVETIRAAQPMQVQTLALQ